MLLWQKSNYWGIPEQSTHTQTHTDRGSAAHGGAWVGNVDLSETLASLWRPFDSACAVRACVPRKLARKVFYNNVIEGNRVYVSPVPARVHVWVCECLSVILGECMGVESGLWRGGGNSKQQGERWIVISWNEKQLFIISWCLAESAPPELRVITSWFYCVRKYCSYFSSFGFKTILNDGVSPSVEELSVEVNLINGSYFRKRFFLCRGIIYLECKDLHCVYTLGRTMFF